MYNSTTLHVAPRSFNRNQSLTQWLYIFLLEYKQVTDELGTLNVYIRIYEKQARKCLKDNGGTAFMS